MLLKDRQQPTQAKEPNARQTHANMGTAFRRAICCLSDPLSLASYVLIKSALAHRSALFAVDVFWIFAAADVVVTRLVVTRLLVVVVDALAV
jgi:hypothetical protein